MEKELSSANGPERCLFVYIIYIITYIITYISTFTLYNKNNLKWIIDLHVRTKSIKLLE